MLRVGLVHATGRLDSCYGGCLIHAGLIHVTGGGMLRGGLIHAPGMLDSCYGEA